MRFLNLTNYPADAFQRSSILTTVVYGCISLIEVYFLLLKCRLIGLVFCNIANHLVLMQGSSLNARITALQYQMYEAVFFIVCLSRSAIVFYNIIFPHLYFPKSHAHFRSSAVKCSPRQNFLYAKSPALVLGLLS